MLIFIRQLENTCTQILIVHSRNLSSIASYVIAWGIISSLPVETIPQIPSGLLSLELKIVHATLWLWQKKQNFVFLGISPSRGKGINFQFGQVPQAKVKWYDGLENRSPTKSPIFVWQWKWKYACLFLFLVESLFQDININ